MDDLRGKVVVITGAAGGIGQAMVERFRELGSHVVAVDIDTAPIGHLDGADGIDIVTADITQGADADRIIAAAQPRIDVLINNAAILDRLALVDETPDDLWRAVVDVNLTGAFLLCRRAIPRMVEQGGGVIVNVGSVAAVRGARAGAAYTAAKHGLVGLTRSIAATYGGTGVRANILHPGGIPTPMSGRVQLSERGSAMRSRDSNKPAPGSPQDIASVAAFLASDASARVNGSDVMVDAGMTAF